MIITCKSSGVSEATKPFLLFESIRLDEEKKLYKLNGQIHGNSNRKLSLNLKKAFSPAHCSRSIKLLYSTS